MQTLSRIWLAARFLFAVLLVYVIVYPWLTFISWVSPIAWATLWSSIVETVYEERKPGQS